METPWREASEEFPVLLLTGPRQVGKTTLLEDLCEPGRRTVTLDDPALRELARRDPTLFLRHFAPPVLIDEIQYAPGLLPYIKMQVDHERRPGRFRLTGSQQFHLMKGVTESLAGRVAIVNLLGFSARETDSRACDVPPFLPLPERLSERETSATASDLAATHRRIWLGSLPALASGQVLLLAPYHTSATTRLIKRPKLHFLDTGLASYLTEWSSPETLASAAMAGAMLETFVVAEVLKSWWHRADHPSLYHYRDKDGREIDLLFAREGSLHPLEIKRAASPDRAWVRDFECLAQLPMRLGLGGVACLVPRRVPLDDRNDAIPVGLI